MTAIDDALAAMASIIRADFDPSPQPAPLWVVNYPLEYDTLGQMLGDRIAPGIVVNQAVNRAESWQIKAVGRGRHTWHMEITAFLLFGSLANDEQAALAAQLQTPYIKAMADVLYSNMTLNGTVSGIGDGGQDFSLFQYRIGMVQWWGLEGWGITYIVPVYQTHNQTMSA